MIPYQDKLKLYDKIQERLIEYRHDGSNWHVDEWGCIHWDLDGVFKILQEEFGF